MKLKILLMFLLTAFLSLAMVSAAQVLITSAPVFTTPVNHDAGTFTVTFDVENTGTSAETVSFTSTVATGAGKATANIPSIANVELTVPPAPGFKKTVSVTGTFSPNQNGEIDLTITAKPSSVGNTGDSEQFKIKITDKPSLAVSSTTISSNDTKATIKITNNGNIDFPTVNIQIPVITGATFSFTSPISLNKGTSKDVEVTVQTTPSLNIGTNPATVTARDSLNQAPQAQGTITINKNFCDAGEKGTDLEIKNVKIDNGDGDDEEWTPLDEIEIEVEVSNEGTEKIQDVFVEIGLYNTQGRNVINDMDNLDDEQIDLGSIKDDKEDTAIFTFTIPSDFDSDNYKLVVKTFSKDIGEDKLCDSTSSDLDNDFFQRISGDREEDEDKHIIFHDIIITPSPAQCGERIQVTGTIVNIGDTDYSDQISVTILNQELGLNLEQVVRKSFDEGDEEVVDFEFDVPANAAQKLHTLEFQTLYDYDEDDNTYDLESDTIFRQTFRVEGNCIAGPTTGPTTGPVQPGKQNVQITADLDSETPEAIAGQQVVVNARIRNIGDSETSYAIGIEGNSEWSRLVSINPRVVSLTPGQSEEVAIVLSINQDASGENDFLIRANYDGFTAEQEVVLTVSSQGQQPPAQISPVVEHLRTNWFIYLIILVNIILIIAIILVIRSMVAPSRPAM